MCSERIHCFPSHVPIALPLLAATLISSGFGYSFSQSLTFKTLNSSLLNIRHFLSHHNAAREKNVPHPHKVDTSLVIQL